MRIRFGNVLTVRRLIMFLCLFLIYTVIIPYSTLALTSIVGVYGSYGMSAAIMDYGTVYAWGNGNPTPMQVSGLSGIKSICLPYSGDLSALKDDGTVWVWQEDGSSAVQVQGLTDIKKIIDIKTGPGTAYALKYDGTVWEYIVNGSPSIPVQVQGLENVKDLTINTALKNDGTVYEWGILQYDLHDHGVIQVKSLDDVSSLISDGLVMKNDGTIWEWGFDHNRITGFEGGNITPHQINISDIKKISVDGDGFFVALKNDGTVWAWGYSLFGELGDSVPSESGVLNSAPSFMRYTMPVQINGLSNIVDIATGNSAAIALESDGKVWAWGDNAAGMLGVDVKNGISLSSTPMKIPVVKNVKSVYMGAYTCYALENDGSLWAWGGNDMGQVGDGTLGDPVYSHGEKVPPVKVLIDSSAAKTPTPTITPSPIATSHASSNHSMVSSTPEASDIVGTHLASPTATTEKAGVLSLFGNQAFDVIGVMLCILIIIGGGMYLFVLRKRD